MTKDAYITWQVQGTVFLCYRKLKHDYKNIFLEMAENRYALYGINFNGSLIISVR